MGEPTDRVEVTQHPVDACAVCSYALEGAPEAMTVRDPFGVSGQAFTFVRCPGCGTLVLDPRPSMDAMSPFYQSDFLARPDEGGGSPIHRLASLQQRLNLVSELRWLRKHLVRDARYLDVSAGNGQIVAAVARSRPDVDVAATEFTAQYRRWIAERIGEDRVCASLSDLPPTRRFDLVSAFGVLEHVEDPRGLVREIHGRLVERGRIMLTVPNPQSLQAQLAGSHWYSWQAPRHWHLPNLDGLERLLRDEGFEVVDRKHFFQRTNSSTAALSMVPSLDPLKPQSAAGLLAYAALFYGLLPAEWMAAALGKGGFMGVVGQRVD